MRLQAGCLACSSRRSTAAAAALPAPVCQLRSAAFCSCGPRRGDSPPVPPSATQLGVPPLPLAAGGPSRSCRNKGGATNLVGG